MVELVNEGSVMASLVGERGGVCSSERTLYVIAVVPLSVPVMVRLPKMAPEKVKTEAAAGAVSEVVVKTVETGMKVVVGKLVMARAEAPVISTKQFREGVMRVLTGAARTLDTVAGKAIRLVTEDVEMKMEAEDWVRMMCLG